MTELAGGVTNMPSKAFMENHGFPDSPMNVGLPNPHIKCAVSHHAVY
jgi:hypothetical protein